MAADRQADSVVTGDDPVLCHLCGHDTSIAMIGHHLATEHGIDPDEIANAPILDQTDGSDYYVDEDGEISA